MNGWRKEGREGGREEGSKPRDNRNARSFYRWLRPLFPSSLFFEYAPSTNPAGIDSCWWSPGGTILRATKRKGGRRGGRRKGGREGREGGKARGKLSGMAQKATIYTITISYSIDAF